MLAKPLPSQDVLNDLFVYSIVTGDLRRRKTGKIAGWFQKSNGYRMVGIGGRNSSFLVHRVIWKMITGDDVPFIDHDDLDKINNSWINLRDCTKSQNQGNRAARADNTLGEKNIHWDEQRQKFVAQVCKDGKRWMRRFVDLEAARSARDKKATEMYGEFARAA